MTDPSVDTQTDESTQAQEEGAQVAEQPPSDNGDVTTDTPTEAAAVVEAAEASAVEPEAEPEPVAEPEPAAEPEQDEVVDATAAAVEVSEEAVAEDEEEEEEEEENDFFAPGDWYVVHTYAGYENKVRANLSSRIQSMNMEDKIYDVVVPIEEVMELKAGKMQSVQKKVFPGYILVRMELDDDSWYVVRNTPGVTGFVGSGAKPTPLDATEVSKILAPKTEERPRPKLEYEVGEVVSVVGGAFAGYSGPVSAIEVDKQRVTVLLDLFGRETPVELTFEQVTKL
jgi:transcriptional antiterminator NusG